METKPYSLQSPEQIAKDYGGNKQKIGEAMQMGLIDPTAGTLAGMFIDRMRSAAQQEQVPQQTVAQQVFSPQPPQGAPPAPPAPAGLGATPEAAQMGQQMPPPSMARGGMVAFKEGGAMDKYRLPPHDSDAEETPHRNFNDILQTILEGHKAGPVHLRPTYSPGSHPDVEAEINHKLGHANLHAQHSLRGNESDYGVDAPLLGGQLSLGAHASHGFVPNSARASYTRSFADGGLTDLPLPDDMFNSSLGDSDGQQYADGGMVGYAEGGPLGPWFEKQAVEAIPGIGITSRQRSATHNAKVGGVKNSYHLTDNARDFVPPKGMTMAQLHSKLGSLFGEGYDIINEGNHVHIEPGRSGAGKRAPLPNRDYSTPEGRAASYEDQIGVAKGLWAGLPGLNTDEAKKYYRDVLSPETQKKDRKEDMWMALANIGASMASTDSPSFLQSVGKALAANLPGIEASKKEHKAAQKDAISALTQIYGMERQDAKDMYSFANELRKTEAAAEEAKADRAARSADIAAQIQGSKDVQRLQNIGYTMRPHEPTTYESQIQTVMEANPGMNKFQAMQWLKTNGYVGGANQQVFPGVGDGTSQAGAAPGAPAMSIVGSRPAQ